MLAALPLGLLQQEKLISREIVTDKQDCYMGSLCSLNKKNHTLRIPRSHKKIPLSITQRISALNRYWVMVGIELSMAAHLMVQIKLDL